MKTFLGALIALVCISTQANYIKKCGADYGKFIKGQKRVVTATTLLESRFALSSLGKKQRKAFTQFSQSRREKLPLEFQSSVYVNSGNKVLGHRVRIMKLDEELSKVYFYFNLKGQLLRIFEKQSQDGEWICEGYKSLVDEVILDLAAELGEYVSSEDMPANVKSISTKKLPANVQKKLNTLIASRADYICPRDARTNECVNGAMDSEEHYIILNQGKVIGYILNVYDYIDHPLWDGSGIYHYLRSSDLKVLTSSSWEG
jgi:hypothetical protein